MFPSFIVEAYIKWLHHYVVMSRGCFCQSIWYNPLAFYDTHGTTWLNICLPSVINFIARSASPFISLHFVQPIWKYSAWWLIFNCKSLRILSTMCTLLDFIQHLRQRRQVFWFHSGWIYNSGFVCSSSLSMLLNRVRVIGIHNIVFNSVAL